MTAVYWVRVYFSAATNLHVFDPLPLFALELATIPLSSQPILKPMISLLHDAGSVRSVMKYISDPQQLTPKGTVRLSRTRLGALIQYEH